MLIAITRQVSRSIVNCELTFLMREPIDVNRARKQHQQYEEALKKLGLAVLSLPEEPDLADSVFVEDTALVLDECAVITRPGAASRLPEIESISHALAPYRTLLRIEAPAHLDGGDILQVGNCIYVGLTRRSDTNAMEQLQEFVAPHGYEVRAVTVRGCLHLKSAVTQISPDTLLINPNWVEKATFTDTQILEIDPTEPHAANALQLPDTVLYPSNFPRTHERLVRSGMQTTIVDADELAKAEGALTCCSLVFRI